MQHLTRLILISLIITLLSSCSTISHDKQMTDLYCDSYFVYDMCALDVDYNGEVDFIYFNGNKEIMLYWENMAPAIPDHLKFHECAQMMDAALRNSASELLFLSDETSFLEKSNTETRIFLHYARYVGPVSSCNGTDDDDDFGDIDDDDF